MSDENNALNALATSIRIAIDEQTSMNESLSEFVTESTDVQMLTAKRILNLDERLGELEYDVKENKRKLNMLIMNLSKILNVSTVELEY